GVRMPAGPNDSLTMALLLPIGGKTACIYLDENKNNGGSFSPLTGLHSDTDWDKRSVVTGQQIPSSKRFTLRAVVEAREITIYLDGNRIYRWTGDPSKLSMHSGMALRTPGRIGLHCACDCMFSVIKAAPLRLPANTEIDLLADLDVRRDALRGKFTKSVDG